MEWRGKYTLHYNKHLYEKRTVAQRIYNNDVITYKHTSFLIHVLYGIWKLKWEGINIEVDGLALFVLVFFVEPISPCFRFILATGTMCLNGRLKRYKFSFLLFFILCENRTLRRWWKTVFYFPQVFRMARIFFLSLISQYFIPEYVTELRKCRT